MYFEPGEIYQVKDDIDIPIYVYGDEKQTLKTLKRLKSNDIFVCLNNYKKKQNKDYCGPLHCYVQILYMKTNHYICFHAKEEEKILDCFKRLS